MINLIERRAENKGFGCRTPSRQPAVAPGRREWTHTNEASPVDSTPTFKAWGLTWDGRWLDLGSFLTLDAAQERVTLAKSSCRYIGGYATEDRTWSRAS